MGAQASHSTHDAQGDHRDIDIPNPRALAMYQIYTKVEEENAPRSTDLPEEPVEVPETEFADLLEDVYDVATFSTIFAYSHRDKPHMQSAFWLAIFALVVNYCFQILILKWTYVYVVVPAIHDMQRTYQDYHADCFDEKGMHLPEKWEAWPDDKKDKLCQMVFSTTGGSNPFLYIILCLWCIAIFNEIRVNKDMIVQGVGSLVTVSDTDLDLVLEHDHQYDKEGNMVHRSRDATIVHLTFKMKVFIYTCIIVPKTLISIILLFIGAMWLTATDHFSDLILNACALEFVISIDEVLYNAFTPFPVKKEIAITKIKMARAAERLVDITRSNFIWKAYIYYFAIFIAVYWYQCHGQHVQFIGIMPGYAYDAACPAFWKERTVRPCMIHNFRGTPCFPYGKHASDEG